MPYYPTIKHFADKSSYALRSVHVSLQKAMMPTVISCENEQQIKILNDFNYEEKTLKPFIATHKEKFDADSMERQPIFDNRENDVLALWDCYVRYRNMFYATFGINNVEIQKRERLTEAEGSGNDEIVRYSLLDDMYEQRKDFVERVNKRFGTEISIELNRDSATVYELNLTGEEKIENMRMANLKGVNLQGANTEEKEVDENEETVVEE
jgi:hypothetical protein